MAKNEFKAAVAQVRIAESYLTCISYAILGLFTATTFQLFTVAALPVLIGIPLGMIVVAKVAAETFRRSAMTFNAGVVGFGLAQVFISLLKMPALLAYSFWAVGLTVDVYLLYRYFKNRSKFAEPTAIVEMPIPQAK